jgi:hypothetical protein
LFLKHLIVDTTMKVQCNQMSIMLFHQREFLLKRNTSEHQLKPIFYETGSPHHSKSLSVGGIRQNEQLKIAVTLENQIAPKGIILKLFKWVQGSDHVVLIVAI